MFNYQTREESLREAFGKALANLNLEFEPEVVATCQPRLESYFEQIIGGEATFEEIEAKLLEEHRESRSNA